MNKIKFEADHNVLSGDMDMSEMTHSQYQQRSRDMLGEEGGEMGMDDSQF